MSDSFRGEVSQKVDGKARVSIPAAFRRVLEANDPACTDGKRPRVILVYGDERRRFVECYTVTGMTDVEARIAQMPEGTRERRFLELNLITRSVTLDVDDEGRIVLPPKVRDKIGLAGDDLQAGAEAMFAGTLATFQLWRRDTYETDLAHDAFAEIPALAQGLDMLALLPRPGA